MTGLYHLRVQAMINIDAAEPYLLISCRNTTHLSDRQKLTSTTDGAVLTGTRTTLLLVLTYFVASNPFRRQTSELGLTALSVNSRISDNEL